MTRGERAADGRRPAWLRPLADAAGTAAWDDLARYPAPTDGSGRASAVLILLADVAAVIGRAEGTRPRSGPSVLLLERAAQMRRHAGQVAFPGGAVDPGDEDAAATALREAREEVGLDPASVDVIGSLPEMFLAPSGYMVTPVMAYWREPHAVDVVDAAEVAWVAVVPVAELAEPGHRFVVRHPSGYTGPGFAAGGLFVWGFTAGLLDAVLRVGGWERDWDHSQFRGLPDSQIGRPAGPISPGTVGE